MLDKLKRVYRCQRNHVELKYIHYVLNNWATTSLGIPKQFIRAFYRNWIGRWPDLKNPRDINEWLIRLTLRVHGTEKENLRAKLSDKYDVRQYLMEKGYGDLLVPCYGVFKDIHDVDFDALPNQFVVKMTHASGYNYICRDKFKMNRKEVISTFEQWQKDTTFGLSSAEWHYTLIKPRIIIEQYLSELGESSLIDYKFHCFNGKVYSILVAYNRNSEDPHGQVCLDNYTLNWVCNDAIVSTFQRNRRDIPKPKNLNRMLEIAADLSKGFEYMRVDLYEVDNKILFGELTFTPNGNVMSYYKQWALDEMLRFANEK